MKTLAEKSDLRQLQEQLNAIYDFLNADVERAVTTHGIVPRLRHRRLPEEDAIPWIEYDNKFYREKFADTEE